MSVIALPELNLILDDVVQAYVKLVGTAGTGYGMGQPEGAFGSGLYLDAAYDKLGANTDPDPSTDFGRALRQFRDNMDPETIFGAKARAFEAAMSRHCRRFGGANYSTLEGLLAYSNIGGGGTFAALQDYRWRTVYNAIKGGSVYPARYNLYYERTNALLANALRSHLVGTGNTAGTAIDSEYAGGVPTILVSGFAGSTSTVTITGTQYNPATQTTTAGVTWTASVTGNGRFYLSVGTATAGAFIVACSNIVDTGGNLTASTLIYVEAERPALRANTLGATASTNSTCCLDSSASAVNDFYNGLVIATDADRYTERTITDYDGNTKIVTISGTWATNPTASTSLYRIKRPAIS